MQIRKAKINDLNALTELENICFATDSDAFTRSIFRYFLTKSSSLCLVVDNKQRIDGYCIISMRKNSPLARIYSIAVNPQAQGSGIAQQLLEKAESSVSRLGKDTLVLEVRKDNLRAQNFYKRNAYTCFAEIKNYYKDGAPALRMHKQLT